MRHLRKIGLAAVAVAALMALLANGSATAQPTELFAEGTTLQKGATILASLEAGTSAVFKSTSGSNNATCSQSEIHGRTAVTTASPLTFAVEELTWGLGGPPHCTYTTKTLTEGHLAFTYTVNGETLTGSGTVITFAVPFSCLYGTGTGTHLGSVNGVKSGHATLAINAVLNEQEPKQFLCVDTTKWTATYVVTSPTGLHLRPKL